MSYFLLIWWGHNERNFLLYFYTKKNEISVVINLDGRATYVDFVTVFDILPRAHPALYIRKKLGIASNIKKIQQCTNGKKKEHNFIICNTTNNLLH